MNYQDTFRRYEVKYLLSETKYRLLRQFFQDKLQVDKFGKIAICNIYFDTPDYRLIRNSLEKPVYKEKLRLRSYGTPSQGDMVYVELKKKYKGVVYKRREKMELTEAQQYLYEKQQSPRVTQISKEIDWFLKLYPDILPAMYISYNRVAMAGIEDPNLRVTFDSNIIWRENDLLLDSGIWGNPILDEGQRLMEVKIQGAMPLWMSHILDDLQVYPVSFSKYGKGYQLSQEIKRKESTKGERKYA